MRACSAGLEADIAAETTTLCKLWRVTRADGTILRFTDCTRPVVYSGDTYREDITFTASAIFTSSKLNMAQNLSLKVMLATSGGIDEADLRAKKYDGAIGEVMVINYDDPTHGVMNLFRGTFGQIKISDKHVAEIELIPTAAGAASRGIGLEAYSKTCRNSLGDVNCTIDLAPLTVAFTVATVPSATVFTAAALTNADDFFSQGFIRWLTGDNVGQITMVQTSVQAGVQITLVSAPQNAIQVGDTGEAVPGCDKIVTTCRDRFNNVINFRGEPNVPGFDILPARPVGGPAFLAGG